jgi:WD40 repeat protein
VTALYDFGMPIQEPFYALSRTITAGGMSIHPIPDMCLPVSHAPLGSIASIDLDFPIVLSGSSDKHIRLFNLETTHGWSTSPEFDAQAAVPLPVPPLLGEDSSEEDTPLAVCQNCGVNVGMVDPTPNRSSNERLHRSRHQCAHGDLVRNVALGTDFVVSGSYDFGVKVWDRKSGRLVTDLVGGHTGRIFSVSFDCTKVSRVRSPRCTATDRYQRSCPAERIR